MAIVNPLITQDSRFEKVMQVVSDGLRESPPKFGLIGVSGVGKSSTINAMFKTSLPVSDTVACTKEFKSTEVSLELLNGQYKNTSVLLEVFDAPGLGEDIEKDSFYLEMYEKVLPKCDVILWVMSARQRAIALDQQYLKKLSAFYDKMVFGINQVDLIEPINWVESFNLPSVDQENNANIILKDRSEKIGKIIGKEPRIVCYSAKQGYHLQLLFNTILESCPKDRAWIYQGLKNFDPKQFQKVILNGHNGLLSQIFTGVFRK
jgi:predicted GTPase